MNIRAAHPSGDTRFLGQKAIIMITMPSFLRYVLARQPANAAALGPRVRLQQHLDLARAMWLMGCITFFNTTIATYIAVDMTGELSILIWTLINYAAGGFMLYDHALKSKRPIPTSVSGRYVARSEMMAIPIGLAFGCLPWFSTSEPLATLIFGCLFTVSMNSGLMCVLPRNPRLILRYLAGSILPIMVYISAHFDDQMIAIAIGMLLLCAVICVGTASAFKLYLKEVRSVDEANQLRDILELAFNGSGQALSVRDRTGAVVFQNDLYDELRRAMRHGEGAGSVIPALDRYWQLSSYTVDRIGRVEMFTDVTRIEDARQEAETLRQEADHASKARSRFIRSVTSELLVPLRTIRLQASMMDSGSQIPLSKADTQRAADQIRLLTEALERRVEQIIAYANNQSAPPEATVSPEPPDAEASPILKLDLLLSRKGRRPAS